jgi:copper transport protein
VGVGGAMVLGTVLSVSYVGSWPALWQTTYGIMLLVKVALLGVTALLGAYNWRQLRPRLGTPGSASRLFQSARLELLVGALLLAATAILVALPAPHV